MNEESVVDSNPQSANLAAHEKSEAYFLWNMKYWLLIGLAFHLVAAYFNAGYYHYDEHFQILEFANYKLGRVPAESLAWEFHEKIRPWFQPAMAYVLIRALVQ